MATKNWARAAACYAAVVARQPQNGKIWIQYGHALREQDLLAEAENAYRRAIESAPDDMDAQLHYARVLQLQHRDAEAMDTFALILRHDPRHQTAYAALIHGGGRHLLPDGFQREAYRSGLTGVVDEVRDANRAIRDWIDTSTYPLASYDAFRHDFAIRPVPAAPSLRSPIKIELDARYTAPSYLRSTLLSLIDQTDDHWYAIVRASQPLAEHSVASLSFVDPRIRFDAGTADDAPGSEADYALHIGSGTVLHPHAIGWFRFVAGRTSCAAAWCDHDHAVEHWRSSRRYEDPQLWGMFDVDLMAQSPSPPAAVLVRLPVLPSLTRAQDDAVEQRRTLLLGAASEGAVVHIPRILASVLRIPERAATAPAGELPIRRWSADPKGAPPFPAPVISTPIVIVDRPGRLAVGIATALKPNQRIHVIIPTRDSAELLTRTVDTLVDSAVMPDRIDFTIVDNRSVLPETASCLARLRSDHRVSVMAMDEPFNWSRANNLASKRSTAENIVFANNDIEMLTEGWDELLLGYLQRSDIGIVGTRLLYPDGDLQHAGMLFGIGEGTPRHDGVHAAATDTGPQDRFDLAHATVAVTGAFMAIRRDLFDRVGGFDELGLAIAYSDIDLCLRVRAESLKILYTAAIELIHHESKTRGLNNNRAKIAWDEGELATIYARWGEALTEDPGYNPHWSRSRPFDGYIDPTMRQILRHIDNSARQSPWSVSPRQQLHQSIDGKP